MDVAYTSLLKRAQQTLDIVLKITGQEDVPVHQVRARARARVRLRVRVRVRLRVRVRARVRVRVRVRVP